ADERARHRRGARRGSVPGGGGLRRHRQGRAATGIRLGIRAACTAPTGTVETAPMSTLVTIIHVIVCLFLMLTVLLQSGKGGGMGAAFGGGSAATVVGSSGATSLLTRLHAV